MAETIAGGRYVGEDGRLHDAHGAPLPDVVEAPEPTPEPKAEAEPEATLKKRVRR